MVEAPRDFILHIGVLGSKQACALVRSRGDKPLVSGTVSVLCNLDGTARVQIKAPDSELTLDSVHDRHFRLIQSGGLYVIEHHDHSDEAVMVHMENTHFVD